VTELVAEFSSVEYMTDTQLSHLTRIPGLFSIQNTLSIILFSQVL